MTRSSAILCLWLSILLTSGGAVLAQGERAIGVEAVTRRNVQPVLAAAPEHNAALFVGVNTFTDDAGLRPLNFAVNDAVAQTHLFVIELKLIPPANTYLALAGEPSTPQAKSQLAELDKAGVQRTDPRKSAILRALAIVGNIPKNPADLVVVSISSHGFEERGVAYAMPADGLRAFLDDTAINLVTVEQRLAQSQAGKRLLLLDACRERPSTDARGGDAPMTEAFRSALAQAAGQAVLASCDAGQISYENPDLGHGVFTYYLLQAMRGQATPDDRGFITLGAVSDYVAEQVRVWAARNKPGLSSDQAQRPWFKGPTDARAIPLALDPGIHARIAGFKADVAAVIDKLKPKIDRRGAFNLDLFARLAEALENADANDAAARDLLANAQDFADGKVRDTMFAAYLDKALETPQQRATRLARETAARAEAEKQSRIAELLAAARANDSKENGKTALTALDELLQLDPDLAEAKALRAKIAAYFGPSKVGDAITNSVDMKLTYIPAGEFTMGSPANEQDRSSDETQHQVRITRPFLMGVTEVTQAQWRAVMGTTVFQQRDKGDRSWALRGEDDAHPMYYVSWHEAVDFCRKLSEREGKHYRLPTEAEWEYACRAGTTGPYAGTGRLDDMGWYSQNSGGQTKPVGQKQPNAWGLYDMHGNVWEWCSDWYDADPAGNGTDPAGPGHGDSRVLRGGSWNVNPWYCRSANRLRYTPDLRGFGFGFRLVLDLP